MKQIIVVAPHPDDETFGCGGTLLKHRAAGDDIHWLIITGLQAEHGFSAERVQVRAGEIKKVAGLYRFATVHNLQLPTTKLDVMPLGEIIKQVGMVFKQVNPGVVYLPYRGDVHTDHRVVFDAVAACTKWFRYPSVKRVLAYETISETDFGINPATGSFCPNVFINTSDYLEKKIEIMKVYSSELGQFPFPRSEEAVRALAALRGAASGCRAAEAFMLLKEII